MLGKFLKLIGLDKPYDESRRAAMTTVSKVALFPVLNSVVPEVLSEPQYSDEELAIAEKLYALGKEIRSLKLKESMNCMWLQGVSSNGKCTTETLESIYSNRDAIEKLSVEFQRVSKIAVSHPNLLGWKKTLFQKNEEKIHIRADGVFITPQPINILTAFRETGELYAPYEQPEQTIIDYIGSKADLEIAAEQSIQLGNLFKNMMDKIKNEIPTPPSRYSLCHTGEREQFSFEQDSKSWREKLKQDHDEYQGRY